MLKRNLLKRTLSVIVSMAMIFQPIPATAYAAENETQAVEQAAEESSSTSENETAPQSSAQESEAAPESSTQESETVPESSMQESEAAEESSAQESEVAPESSTQESETVPESSAPDESSTVETETVTEEVSVEESSIEETEEGTIEEPSVEETETEQEAEKDNDLQSVVSDFVVRNITADYKGFTIEYEASDTSPSYDLYYAPKDDPTAKKKVSLDSYESKNRLVGLNDDTDYVLTVHNSVGAKVAEGTVKTEKYPAEVTYIAEPAGPTKINLSITVSNYAGENPNARVAGVFVVKDEAGEVIKEDRWEGKYADNQVTFDPKTVEGLEANKKYKVDFYLCEGGSFGSHFVQQTVEVTTNETPFKAEDVTFTLTENETDATKVNYVIEVANYNETLPARMYCRIKDSDDIYSLIRDVTLKDGTTQGTMALDQAGATYEITLYMAGLVITGEYTTGDAEYIAEFTEDTDAYDSVLSFQLKTADGSALDSTKSYKVWLSYLDNGYYNGTFGSGTLDSENAYKATVKTSEKFSLRPDKTYKLRWRLRIQSEDTTEYLNFYQTIRTKKSTVKADIKSRYIDYIEYDVALGGRTENLSGDIVAYQDIKGDDGSYRQFDSELRFGTSNNYKVTDCCIADLKEGTKYTVSLQNDYSGNYGTFSFETPADDKTIAVTETKSDLHKVEMKTDVKGTTYRKNTEYAILYFREKGTDGTWEKKSDTISAGSSTSTFDICEYNGAELKEDTTYEYVLGIGNSSTQKDNLKAAVTGTFTTKKAIVLERITLSAQELKLNMGYADTAVLKVTPIPATASAEVNWSSSDEKIVTVDANGNVTAKGCGEAVITATSKYNDKLKAECKVSVGTKIERVDITALRTSDSSYPAIERGENTFELAYNEKLGLSYQAEGVISPSQEFHASDFTWESSNATVATVSDEGVITPKKAGSVKITVKPKNNETYLNPDHATAVITLNIKPTPIDSVPEVYAVTNEKSGMKLADVAFPAEWGEGWSWNEPQTPLYSLPVHSDAYAFDAIYTGETYYAYQGKVNVYISTITGVSVYETAGSHRNVVMVSEDGRTDTLSLQISPTYYGRISASKYTVKIPDVNHLTIAENKNTGYFDITAKMPGSYTIKPQILIGEKVVATGSYKFKAVAENQIATIALSTDEKEGAVISGNMIAFDASADGTKGSSFTLKATAKDRSGAENTDTKLAWSITDKSVATISVSADTRTATVNVKGGGHAVIQITAKDAAGVSAQWRLEIQDHKPRIEMSKVTVNTAYDYDSSEGRRLAYNQKGSIEIVPVYGESINDVKIIGAQSDEADTSLGIENYSGYKWVVRPLRGDISTSKAYKCRIRVTTSAGTYTYPLTAAIINKAPKVTAKITRGMNLFYIPESGELEVALESSLFSIASMTWEDKAAGNGDNVFEFSNGYTYSNKAYSKKYFEIRQDKVRVKNGALVDTGVDKGTITVKLNGVLKEYKFDIQIKTSYRKPTLKTVGVGTGKNTVNIIPAVNGGNAFHFSVYDNLSKSTLYYTTGNERSKYSYDEISCDSDRISLSAYNNYSGDRYSGMTAVYSGTSQKETVNYAVDSVYWRESLSASQTIKTITPKAVLSRSKLIYNTGYINSELVRIYMSNYSDALEMTDVVITGANVKAQTLLDDEKLEIIHAGTDLYVRLNKLKYMKGDVPTGKYTYNLTPYYTDTQTGEKKALNTLKLTINFTNKAVTAKASTRGSIDLAQSNDNNLRTNSIAVTANFANIGSDYTVTGVRLTGEYSKYFYISTYTNNAENKATCHIKIRSDQKGRLKAGQSYNLQLVYTLQATGGETIDVTSNTITIKPKQTAPKIKVVNDGQTLYAASDLTRSYTLYAPNSTYGIQDAYGSIDVNKDGEADIVVSKYSTSSNYVYVTVRITDRDAVLATAAGKTYSIPVTVKVIGRDGIAKDSSAVIKVKVKR